jgi:hypothetical protein
MTMRFSAGFSTSGAARVAAGGIVILAVAFTAACADKVFRPRLLGGGSPKIVLQLQTTGAQVSSPVKQIVVLAAYQSTVSDTGKDNTGNYRIIGGPVTAPVTSSSQQVSLKVDLSTCLTDGTRLGSQTACSFQVLFILRDSVPLDTNSDFFSHTYDSQWLGPYDAVPGSAPTIPPINLSYSRFAVHEWLADEALRLGGTLTPTFFTGPIAGVSNGTSPPTLFALTRGNCNRAQLAIFQNGTWRRVDGPGTDCSTNPSPSQQFVQFNDVAAFASNDVYIAAQDGLYHYDGSAITAVSAVRDNLLSVGIVNASGGARYLAAGTSQGSVWFGNLTTWQRYTVLTAEPLDGVCVTGASEAFASSATNGHVYRFDGTAWTAIPAATPTGAELQCLPSPPAGQAFANSLLGATSPLYRWNGGSWSPLPSSGLGPTRVIHFGVSSASEMWAVGDSSGANRAFYRFDGIGWHEVARRQAFQPVQRRPWANPAGGEAYVASSSFGGRVERVTAGGSSVVSYQPSLKDAIMTSASSAFAVGRDFFLSRFDGTRWTVDTPPAGTQTSRALQGVWSDGPANAWAVGEFSTVVHWDGTKWTLVSASVSPVVSPGDNYNAVWGSGGTVWVAGDASILRCGKTVSACSSDQVPGAGALHGVWGTSATNVFAVGSAGRILQFNGSAWTSMTSPTSLSLSRVWGSGVNDVYAVGDNVMVHFDGKTWQNVPLTNGLKNLSTANAGTGYQPSSFQLGIWGTGPSEIYVGSPFGDIARYDGFLWQDMTNNNTGLARIVAITGFSGGCAIAITDGQNGNSGLPILFRGAGPSGCLGTPMTAPASWP